MLYFLITGPAWIGWYEGKSFSIHYLDVRQEPVLNEWLFSCYSKGAQGELGTKGERGDPGLPGTDGIPGQEGPRGEKGFVSLQRKWVAKCSRCNIYSLITRQIKGWSWTTRQARAQRWSRRQRRTGRARPWCSMSIRSRRTTIAWMRMAATKGKTRWKKQT